MALFKCKMCGGSLEFEKGDTVGVCESCGTKQSLPKTNDEIISNLFNRANNLRLKCEFDKAAQIYEKIVEQDNSEAEAHWGIVLCKYGIEYVEDPKTFKRIPTCHRTLFEAVTTDADYLAAIDYSDAAQQLIYEGEARAIDKIQKEILAIVKNEKPFDVFICYKETDENGKRTLDSTIANDIYHQLTQEGFKVFFAAITLEDKLGQEYEPYIFAALNSAKVMLVLGTKPEYYSAVWVKNEWSRFLQLMKVDRSRLLIPCYRDMDAYDLPEEFAHLQAQDMSKIGFINDVVRGIKKISQTDTPKPTIIKETVISEGNSNTAPLLKRAFMFLEDGEWDSANEYCEKVLDINPEEALAYLGKLMSELRVRKQEKLKDCAQPFDGNNNYRKVLRFADDKLKSEIAGYIQHINTRNENARLNGIYNRAKSAMSSATTKSTYIEAARLFETIRKYQDSTALAKECYEKAEIIRKDTILANAEAKMQYECVFDYKAEIEHLESIIASLVSISGWKNADEKIRVCKKKIEDTKAKIETDRLEQERKKILKRKKSKKIAIILSAMICAFIVLSVVLSLVISNYKYNKSIALMDEKYNKAIALMDEGNVVKAYEALIALDGYKDSTEKAMSIYSQYKVEKLKRENVKVGDYIFFGTYEQDNNISNGKEDIEWLVLAVENGKVLVISKYALDCQQYNTSHTDVTWETCSLRKWLNNEFLSSIFSVEEQSRIPTVTVYADKNPENSTSPGNTTQDKIFLLSITEANRYFSSDSARQCKATAYAEAQGVSGDSKKNCSWWLRSPGQTQSMAADVYSSGSVNVFGYYVSRNISAIRPALWIDLNT